MEISKSTPYVRYRENISSTLHKGTIHIESEYFDRERKTTIESIEGQTWQNMVNGENKEEDILPRLGMKIEGNEDIFDSVEQHMPIDTIIGDIEPVANEDGTYTYEISTMEGSYAKTLDGENNFSLTSDGLVGSMYIKYNAQGEEVNGNIVMINGQKEYTIENSNTGEIKSAILKGNTERLPKLNKTFRQGSYGASFDEVPASNRISYNGVLNGYSTFKIKCVSGWECCLRYGNDISWSNEIDISDSTISRFVLIFRKSDDSGIDLNSLYYEDVVESTNISELGEASKLVSVKMPVLTTSNEGGTKTNILTTPQDLELRKVGDIQDELNLETGELTQEVYEYTFTGDEVWGISGGKNGGYSYFNCSSNQLPVIFDYGDGANVPINCNRLPILNYRDFDTGRKKVGINLTYSFRLNFSDCDSNNGATVEDLKTYLKANPTTVQYPISKSVKTVDLTIKDQDNKTIQSLHTYPSTTHINLSSNGLIPNTEISYIMYGNIGETTGQQITDGTDSKLIEGKIYGDTLLNTLPSPSLKNSMDYNISMQKLNNGYDNINVADGEFKKATLYGNTLVNLFEFDEPVTTTTDRVRLISSDKFKNRLLNDTYTIINTSDKKITLDINNKSTNDWKETVTLSSGQKTSIVINDTYIKMASFLFSDGWSSNNLEEIKHSLIVLNGEYTNQDIPYFEGMGSVTSPSVITSNKYDALTLLFAQEPRDYMGWTTLSFIETFNGRIKIKFKPNVSSTLRATIITSQENTYTSSQLKDGIDVHFTEVYHIGFHDYYSGIENGEGIDVLKEMINNGDVEISLHEDGYKSTTLTVNEEISLRKIGDVQDELNLSTSKLTQRIGELKLTKSMLTVHSTAETCYRIRLNWDNFPNIKTNGNNTKKLCNLLNNAINEAQVGIFTHGIGGYFLLNVDINIASTATDAIQWLLDNDATILYELATPTTSTVDISIVDQDGTTQSKLQSYANGYINVQSQGLLPSVNYEVSTNNSYYLDIVKTNTQYTSKGSSDSNATIDGNIIPLSANGTFTTPSTITNNLMVLDTPVDDLMFIEGDLTSRNIDYFTGISSVENPIIYTLPNNINEVNFMGMIEWDMSNQTSYLYRLPIQGQRLWYKTYNMWNSIDYYDKDKNHLGSETNQVMGGSYQFDDLPEEIIAKAVYFKINYKVAPEGKIMQLRTVNNLSDIPYTDIRQLSTTPQITLNGIGDVKDEWDVVNEMVTRRIGKVVLDGSEGWESTGMTYEKGYAVNIGMSELIPNAITPTDSTVYLICDKLKYIGQSIHIVGELTGYVCSYHNNGNFYIRMPASSINEVKEWLANNKPTLYCKLATPTTESVRIVPQNHRQSTTSLTLQSPLQKVGNVADQLRWNPYKGHYVRYNYIQDGVANSTYTFEDLKDMNERKFVNLYNQRTYIDTDHTVQVISHGISRYCLAEQGKQYHIRWDWIEQPSADTIKVDLCGNVKEIPSTDNSVVIDIEKFTHQFIQIQGLGLTGKITNLMVIETVNGEIPDVDFFSGIQCVGNTVTVDGNTKVQIDMEQTNGNLFDNAIEIYNNGNNIRFMLNMVRPNKTYTFKHGNNSVVTKTMKYNQKQFNDSGQYTIQISNNGSANVYYPIELCYADMVKDGIRPRYYDKESIILPMKLCRVGNIYDNLYYDDLRGCYRIQQSIGHKYFTGETTEVWTMETTNGYRTIKFTCTNANIDQIAYGETICNQWKHLSTINDDIEGFIIYNGNFVIRVDKDRLIDKTVDGFKALLTSNPIHLFYQLKTPQMINLTEYPKRIELNTYRDEIFTFFKGMNPTKFTLSVPMDKTYRYAIAEEGQGLANRVTVNDETISAENMVAIKEVRGQGIANIIEDVNNVVITPRPNHEGRTTSHTLNNTKPAIIMVHGFEPSGDTAIGKYNVTDKAYQLKVMSSNGDNSLSDYYVLNVPYKLETYADGTKDMVYYDEAYKQWIFKGSSVKEYTVASNGALSETIEIFRGLIPRSGLIAEFKLMFTSGTTAAHMYYSLDGITYGYTQLRGMSDGNYLYVGIFNTGGTKIDIAYKTDPNEEYTNLVPLSTQVPECFMVNQITNCTFCELTLDKQYIYSEMNAPIELDTYEGSTKVFMDGNATDTNIIIRNEGIAKIVNTYTDTDYTVYWKYVDGLGNLRVTLGGTTVEVDGKQEYATLKTQLNAPQELLYVGGYNLSIKDLMVVKGAKIDDLPYFENSREVGTLVLDEEGNKSYKITLVQGGSVLEQRDENAIAFKDDNKHNVIVHKIVGVCPTKVD